MGVRVSRTKHPVAGKQPEQGGVRVTDRGLGAAGSCGGPSANLSSSSASTRIMEGRGCSRPHHLQPHRASRRRHTAEAARPPRSTPSPPTRPLFLAIDFIFMVGSGIVCHRPCSRNRSTGLGCALTTQSLSREAILLLLLGYRIAGLQSSAAVFRTSFCLGLCLGYRSQGCGTICLGCRQRPGGGGQTRQPRAIC